MNPSWLAMGRFIAATSATTRAGSSRWRFMSAEIWV
jgi:hypothetical protein